MEKFEEKVNKFLDELSAYLEDNDTTLTLNTKLEDISWDSMLAITSISLIDEIFSVVIPVEGLGMCETIGEIISLIEK